MRELGKDDILCGHKVPRGSHVVTALKAVHQQWEDPRRWQPERFMPGGEFDRFSEDIRQYMVRWLLIHCLLLAVHCILGSLGSVWFGDLSGALCMCLTVPCCAVFCLKVPCAMQFVPFIQGPRNCLGQNFALLEARIVLALLVKVSSPPWAQFQALITCCCGMQSCMAANHVWQHMT